MQTFADLEIVVVDDGSTDGSRAVVDEYVGQHPNIAVVTTENRGLGAARNLGATHIRGQLLAFVDSDDTLPRDAYAKLVAALDESGSDFAVGAVQRHRGERRLPLTPRQRDLHRERRLGVTADEFPEILADVFAWNKVFRRSFWERAQMSFPEGVRYEDQVALTRAFLVANRFDVVEAPVYLWRLREDSSSITQRRHELADLQDRLVTKRSSLDLTRALGSPAVLRRFYNDALSMDLPSYFWEIPRCDETYWRLLSSGLRDLWAAGPPFTESTLPVQHRLVAWLVAQDRRSEAEAVLGFVKEHRPDLPVDEREGHQVALLPYHDDPEADIPAELYRLTEHDAALHRRARTG